MNKLLKIFSIILVTIFINISVLNAENEASPIDDNSLTVTIDNTSIDLEDDETIIKSYDETNTNNTPVTTIGGTAITTNNSNANNSDMIFGIKKPIYYGSLLALLVLFVIVFVISKLKNKKPKAPKRENEPIQTIDSNRLNDGTYVIGSTNTNNKNDDIEML